MKLILLAVLIFFVAKNHANGEEDNDITWNENVGSNCKFSTKDLLIEETIEEDCLILCEDMAECTHYTWKPNSNKKKFGGICYLKTGDVSKEDAVYAEDSTCGILNKFSSSKTTENKIEWNGNSADSCEFPGNDLAHDIKRNLTKCFNLCEETIDCTHFTWTNENEGTCWMKTGKIGKHDAAYINDNNSKCGIIAEKNINLSKNILKNITKSKFTIRFVIKPLPKSVNSIDLKIGPLNFILSDRDIEFEQNSDNQNVKLIKMKKKKPDMNFLHFNCSEGTIWVSLFALDKFNLNKNFVKFGMGYVLLNNTIAEFLVDSEETLNILKNLNQVEIDRIAVVKDINLEKKPLIKDFSVKIFDSKQITWSHLNENLMTQFDLPQEGRILYEKIKGDGINLTPEQIEAINYSIDSEGCELNTKLKEKAKKAFGSNNQKTSYLRCTFDYVDGGAPGQPLVVEIWPKGHFSPIHNHGNTVGVIKLLDGTLKSEWFNPLAETNYEELEPVKTGFLSDGEFTWLSPFHYQTHRLTNSNSTRAAISIQAYSHPHDIENTEESFNYILPKDGQLKRFYPVSDYHFEKLIEITSFERKSKSCHNRNRVASCCQYTGRVCGFHLKQRKECPSPAQLNAVYFCNKVTDKYRLVQECSNFCFQDYLNSQCKNKNKAIAELKPGAWNNINGTFSLQELDQDTLIISGQVSGLKKNSLHGFHIHEYGDISNNCQDIGKHFNPLSTSMHGGLENDITKRHAGDLGNIKTDKDGVAKINITLKNKLINLDEKSFFGILNRAIALHENEDDLNLKNHEKSAINGNAGLVIACGTIRRQGLKRRKVEIPEFLSSELEKTNGEWSEVEYCPKGSHAIGFSLKNNDIIDEDKTIFNTIRLICNDDKRSKISSYENKLGEFSEEVICPDLRPLNGFRLKYDSNLIHSIRMKCNDKYKLELSIENEIDMGDWGTLNDCKEGFKICGLQVQYKKLGLTNAKFVCCA